MYTQLWAVNMIDPVTGWIEIVPIDTKRADVIANLVEQNWLTCYTRPNQVTYNHGTEFMAEFSEMIDKDYDIKRKPILVHNPQANAIVEQVHQTMGNMLHTFDIPNMENPEE